MSQGLDDMLAGISVAIGIRGFAHRGIGHGIVEQFGYGGHDTRCICTYEFLMVSGRVPKTNITFFIICRFCR